MQDRIYDLLIVGGGINGAGIARDAAGQGISVLLAEKGDLASDTSSASSKLIHGGLRYLEHYDFALVRDALAERRRLHRLAPHLVRPLGFVMPVWKGPRASMFMLSAGLTLYDWMGGRGQPVPWHRRFSARTLLKHFPYLDPERLLGGSAGLRRHSGIGEVRGVGQRPGQRRVGDARAVAPGGLGLVERQVGAAHHVAR